MPLVRSFDPDTDGFADAVQRGAVAIYGVVTGNYDPNKAQWAWDNRAKPITRERHLKEAEACLIAGGWRGNR